MKKLKVSALLSIICLLFGFIGHAQLSSPLTFTRTDVGTSIGGTVTVNMQEASGLFTITRGTQSFTNGASGSFTGDNGGLTGYSFNVVISGVGTSAYYALPLTYTDSQIIVFNLGSSSIAVTVYRTGDLTWGLSAIYGPPVG